MLRHLCIHVPVALNNSNVCGIMYNVIHSLYTYIHVYPHVHAGAAWSVEHCEEADGADEAERGSTAGRRGHQPEEQVERV